MLRSALSRMAEKARGVAKLHRVGVEDAQKRVADEYPEPEGDQDGGHQAVVGGQPLGFHRLHGHVVEQEALEPVAEREHRRDDDDQGEEGGDRQDLQHHRGQVGADDEKIAMGQVDEAHHPEGQRQADRDHGVVAADDRAGQEPVGDVDQREVEGFVEGAHPLPPAMRRPCRRWWCRPDARASSTTARPSANPTCRRRWRRWPVWSALPGAFTPRLLPCAGAADGWGTILFHASRSRRR